MKGQTVNGAGGTAPVRMKSIAILYVIISLREVFEKSPMGGQKGKKIITIIFIGSLSLPSK